MSTREGRSVEVDTGLRSIELVGAAGGHAWVRESERNLLVAFDLETGRESFRHESARSRASSTKATHLPQPARPAGARRHSMMHPAASK
jgi:hypothetical protein